LVQTVVGAVGSGDLGRPRTYATDLVEAAVGRAFQIPFDVAKFGAGLPVEVRAVARFALTCVDTVVAAVVTAGDVDMALVTTESPRQEAFPLT